MKKSAPLAAANAIHYTITPAGGTAVAGPTVVITLSAATRATLPAKANVVVTYPTTVASLGTTAFFENEAVVNANLRRQGILATSVKKQTFRRGGKVSEKDVALFTRQLATMMKSGVPLLQTFDIVGRGHDNPAVGKLLLDIKTDVETGSSLSQAFRKFPLHFDQLYCNLVAAGEQAGILESLLDRLATYKEKMLAIKAKIKSAMFYPTAVMIVAFIITAIIMIFVIPAFKQVFTGFGADLPAPTLMVMAISDFFVEYWYLIFGTIFGGAWSFFYTWQRSETMQIALDRLFLRLPVFGPMIRKAVMARWTRTLSTMFAAGVPLVESLDSVGGAAGNYIYKIGTRQIHSFNFFTHF